MQAKQLGLLLSLLALAACKPVDGSRVLAETGGDAATWGITAKLNNQGGLTVEKSGTGADDTNKAIQRLELQINASPDGQIYSEGLHKGKWMPLSSGETDLSFNVVLWTKDEGLCYANAVKLSGSTTEKVHCKAKDKVEEERRKALKETLRKSCEALAKEKIEGKETFYATYDAKDEEYCTCNNGLIRDVRYDFYYSVKDKPEQQFKTDCKTSESEDPLELNYYECLNLESVFSNTATAITAGTDWCQCKNDRLRYDDARFKHKPQDFKNECLKLAGATQTDGQATTTLSNNVRLMKTKCEESAKRRDTTVHCECRTTPTAADAKKKTNEYRTYKDLAEFETDLAKVTCN